jgi:hypothetical protein
MTSNLEKWRTDATGAFTEKVAPLVHYSSDPSFDFGLGEVAEAHVRVAWPEATAAHVRPSAPRNSAIAMPG